MNELNIIEIIWQSSVIVKGVLALLLISSIYSWAIVFNKYKQLKDVDKSDEAFLNIYKNTEDLNTIFDKGLELKSSLLARSFNKAFAELKKLESSFVEMQGADQKATMRSITIDNLKRSLNQANNINNELLSTKLSTLASIGSVAPFIGLLGTVWGIIDSFRGLASGGGSIEAVAPGIAEALVATAIGLFAAIPAVWFYNKFNNKINTSNLRIESFSEEIINLIERQFFLSRNR